MKVLNFEECVGSTSSTQSASKLAFCSSKLLFTSFFETFRCQLWISILLFTWASSAVCLWISVLFFLLHLYFFGSTTSFIFSISCCPLFSITWEKRSKLYGETRNGRSESGKRKMQRVIERHARRWRFNNFFKIFFYCCDLNRENRERFLDPAGSTAVWTVSCFLCIERFFGFKEPDYWEGHG